VSVGRHRGAGRAQPQQPAVRTAAQERPEVNEWSRVPVAQFRYDAEHNHWTLYCADRNSRWHRYDLVAPGTVEQLLEEIDHDPTGIFWG
jgi:hypothetical protein